MPRADVDATIRSGPRWESVLTAVGLAEEALEPPLSDAELAGGWTDELRDGVLADVRHVRDELLARPDTTAVLDDWRGVDAIEAEGDERRLEAILDVDLVLGDLDRAEHALDATEQLLADLAVSLTREDRDAGFDEAVRDELAALAEGLRATLAVGAYLEGPRLDDWADALRALGFRRAVDRRWIDDDADNRGFNGKRIEQFPPGRRFEALAIYDGELFGVAMPDTVADQEPDVAVPGDVAPNARSDVPDEVPEDVPDAVPEADPTGRPA